MGALHLAPASLAEANAFVHQHHRHHRPVVGHKFSIAAANDNGDVIGVVIVGRPVARSLDDGLTLEVTRLASNGSRNVCSFLYGASARAAFAMGYKRVVTYTLATETGVTLAAAGWTLVAQVRGRSWSCPSRPRVDTHPTVNKLRFERTIA